MTIDDLKKGLLQKLQQVGQGFTQGVQQVQKNPIVQNIEHIAAQSNPITNAISTNNSFANAFSQVPKVNFTQNIQNPFLKAIAGIPESIVNSPMNTAQGIQGLNKNFSDIYTRGRVEPLNILANAGRAMDLPLNLMGGSLVKSTGKNIAEQGFKQIGKQGLWNIAKEGAWEGGKLGTAFGLSGGLQSGENITNPLDYAKNLGMNTAIGTLGGAALGGLGAGAGYGINKGAQELSLIKTREALTNFHNDIKSGAIANSQNPVFQKYKSALGINSKTETTILQATQRLANKMDDPSAEFVLERSKSLLPPEFKDQPTPVIADIWSHIIARKNNRAVPGDVPLLTKDLDNAIFKQFGQGGKIKLGAKVGEEQPQIQKEVGETYYHGTTKSNLTELKPGGVKGRMGESTIPGTYITKDYNTAAYYGQKNGIQMFSPHETKFNGKVFIGESVADVKQKLGLPDWSDASRGRIPALLQKKGYDAIQIKGNGEVGEIIVTNPKAVQLASQSPLKSHTQLGEEKYPEIPGWPSHYDTSKIIPIKNNGKIVGGIDVVKDRLNPQRLVVNHIRITPENQGKGLGTEAVNQLFKDNPDITEIVGHSTDEAKSFWLKQGAVFSDSSSAFIIERPNPSSPLPQKQFTQLGSATNTRADQIASKFKKVDPFEAEMDAQIGKPLEQRGINVKRKPTPVPLATDQATQNFARGSSEMGSNAIKSDFADYVNQRRATKVEGFIKNKEFSDLNAKGINGLTEFQANEKTGRFADLKNFFDTKRQEVIDKTGKDFGYKQDYLPQLWDNTPEQIQQAFGNRLSKTASFEMSSVIKDYKTGIDLGLTPKYKTLGDLAGWYESRANKLIADSTYFNKLAKDGMIQPSNKAPLDWVTLNPDRFPKVTVDTGETTYSGAYKAPPELAKMINNYLYDPREAGGFAGGMAKVADYVSNVKNKTLSFGIPGTAINAHGVNILARHTLFGTGGNPISRLLKGGAMLLDQKYSQGVLDKELSTAPRAVKAGLSLSTEVENNLMNDTFRKKFGAKWNTAFEKPLFDKMIPALKLSSFNNLVKDGKMSEQDAAKLVNNVYGGINWEQAGRDRNLANFLRTVILAPDWAETNLKMGGNIAKSFVKGGPVASRYRTMAATMLGTYAAMNVANKLTSGHYMYENDPGHTLEVQVGYTSDGQKRYVRPLGTALDFVRLPMDAISSIAKGDLTSFSTMIRNRLSIPAGVGVGFLTDTNYRGQAIGYKGKDKYGNDMPLSQRAVNIGAEAASLIGVPSFLRQLGSSATGQQGLEQGLTQGFELPLRYVGAGNSKTQKFVGDVAGVKGKDLYDLKKRFQGESPFSENQKRMINQGGMPALDAVMNQRIITRQSNQIKDVQKKAASGEISPEEAQKAMQDILKQPVKTPTQSNSGVAQAHAADNGVFEYNNKYSYIDNTGKTTTIDINPPSKGNGIDAFANKDWNITKARDTWNSNLPQNTKDEIFKKLGVDPKDVRYDALAHHNADVSTQYILSKSADHVALLKNIITGRQESISGTQFASNGVIDNLVEQGQLSKEEAKQLKSLKYDSKGNNLSKATSGGKKGKKLPLRAVKKANFKIATKQSQAKTIKSGKPTKIKAPNVSFDTQFSKKGGIPQAKKYAVKFNV